MYIKKNPEREGSCSNHGSTTLLSSNSKRFLTILTNRKKNRSEEADSRRWCACAYQSVACHPDGGCDVRMGPADLYTQTRAQTVNNGTHTHSHEPNVLTHTHPLPCVHLAVTEPTCNYQWPNTCPHTYTHIPHVYIVRGFMQTRGFTTLSEAPSPAAPEEVMHCSFTLNPTYIVSIYNVKNQRHIIQMKG